MGENKQATELKLRQGISTRISISNLLLLILVTVMKICLL